MSIGNTRGRFVDGVWIFGAIEKSGEIRLEIIPDNKYQTEGSGLPSLRIPLAETCQFDIAKRNNLDEFLFLVQNINLYPSPQVPKHASNEATLIT